MKIRSSMRYRVILSPEARSCLFNPPDNHDDAQVRYILDPEDALSYENSVLPGKMKPSAEGCNPLPTARDGSQKRWPYGPRESSIALVFS